MARLTLLETQHRAQLDALPEAELRTWMDAVHGAGSWDCVVGYMDQHLTLAEVEGVIAGDPRLCAQVWAHLEAWKEETR